MQPEKVADLARALGHPIRVAILDGLAQAGQLSPRAFADAHPASLATTAHHFRVLASSGLIQLDHTEPRRGALQHYYVLAPRGRAANEWLRAAPDVD
jgi:predicted transcriptional regulator